MAAGSWWSTSAILSTEFKYGPIIQACMQCYRFFLIRLWKLLRLLRSSLIWGPKLRVTRAITFLNIFRPCVDHRHRSCPKIKFTGWWFSSAAAAGQSGTLLDGQCQFWIRFMLIRRCPPPPPPIDQEQLCFREESRSTQKTAAAATERDVDAPGGTFKQQQRNGSNWGAAAAVFCYWGKVDIRSMDGTYVFARGTGHFPWWLWIDWGARSTATRWANPPPIRVLRSAVLRRPQKREEDVYSGG